MFFLCFFFFFYRSLRSNIKHYFITNFKCLPLLLLMPALKQWIHVGFSNTLNPISVRRNFFFFIVSTRNVDTPISIDRVVWFVFLQKKKKIFSIRIVGACKGDVLRTLFNIVYYDCRRNGRNQFYSWNRELFDNNLGPTRFPLDRDENFFFSSPP